LFDDIITTVFIIVEIGFKKVRKEKDLKYCKHDEQLNKNDCPQGSAKGHTFKTIRIESEDTYEDIRFHQGCFWISKLTINKG